MQAEKNKEGKSSFISNKKARITENSGFDCQRWGRRSVGDNTLNPIFNLLIQLLHLTSSSGKFSTARFNSIYITTTSDTTKPVASMAREATNPENRSILTWRRTQRDLGQASRQHSTKVLKINLKTKITDQHQNDPRRYHAQPKITSQKLGVGSNKSPKAKIDTVKKKINSLNAIPQAWHEIKSKSGHQEADLDTCFVVASLRGAGKSTIIKTSHALNIIFLVTHITKISVNRRRTCRESDDFDTALQLEPISKGATFATYPKRLHPPRPC